MQDLNISIIQAPLVWEDKRANLAYFESKISAISNSDVIVLPEMFTTSFSMNSKSLYEKMNGDSVTWMRQMAINSKSCVVGSLIIEDQNSYFNRLIWAFPNGEISYYDKRHLFRMANEDAHFSPGKLKIMIEWKGWKICPLICYDLRFPVYSRRSDNFDYDCLIYVANWPAIRSHAWKVLLQARAIENQSYCVGVNRVGEDANGNTYSGDSVIISQIGEAISSIPTNVEGIANTTLNYSELMSFRQKFPAHLDADQFELKL